MKERSLQKTTPSADLEKVASRAGSIPKLGKVSALALGLKDDKAALQIVMQALNVPSGGASLDDFDRLMTASGTLLEIGPKGALESLLAVQMMGVQGQETSSHAEGLCRT